VSDKEGKVPANRTIITMQAMYGTQGKGNSGHNDKKNDVRECGSSIPHLATTATHIISCAVQDFRT
jgi:hypothetical protein